MVIPGGGRLLMSEGPLYHHTVDCKPFLKSQLAQIKSTFVRFLLQFWSRTTRIPGVPKQSQSTEGHYLADSCAYGIDYGRRKGS